MTLWPLTYAHSTKPVEKILCEGLVTSYCKPVYEMTRLWPLTYAYSTKPVEKILCERVLSIVLANQFMKLLACGPSPMPTVPNPSKKILCEHVLLVVTANQFMMRASTSASL